MAAIALRKEAEEILEGLIAEQGDESDYPWHILLSHTADWLGIWEQDIPAKRAELEFLRTRAREACEARPHSDELRSAKNKVERAYLATANRKD